MRLLTFFEYPSLNGGEYSYLAIASRLQSLGFTFIAAAPAEGELAAALTASGIEVVPFHLQGTAGRLSREEICALATSVVREKQPDIVHANSLAMSRIVGAIASQLRADFGIPTVGHLRDIIKLKRGAIADLNQLTRIATVSQATLDWHVAQGLDAEICDVSHNGVDGNVFRPQPKTGWLAHELGWPEDCLIILGVGQIGMRKGWETLTAAFEAIVDKFPTARLAIVGERHSTKQEAIQWEGHLVKQAEASAGRFRLLGRRDDVSKIMNEASMLVHPAKQEPLGRVLLEAAATGLPIIASTVGGTEEIFNDATQAVLIPPGDVGRISVALSRLLSDETLRQSLGSAARARQQEAFTTEQAANRMAAVLKKLD